jgi:hypothetical protein
MRIKNGREDSITNVGYNCVFVAKRMNKEVKTIINWEVERGMVYDHTLQQS